MYPVTAKSASLRTPGGTVGADRSDLSDLSDAGRGNVGQSDEEDGSDLVDAGRRRGEAKRVNQWNRF